MQPDDVETRIALMLSSDDARRDPRNRAVPVLDHFEDDEDKDIAYLVMPLLRALDDPPFLCVGDVVDFCDQVLEVSRFDMCFSNNPGRLGPNQSEPVRDTGKCPRC